MGSSLDGLVRALRDEAEKHTKEAIGRESTAKSLRASTDEDRKEARRIAEMMTGRKFKKTKAGDDEVSAEIEDRIAAKLFAKAQKLTDWANAVAEAGAGCGAPRASTEGDDVNNERELHPDLDTIVIAHMKLRRSIHMLSEKCEPEMAKTLRKILGTEDAKVFDCGCPITEPFKHRTDCFYFNFARALSSGRSHRDNPEYIGKDGRSHFRVTGGNCACGWTIINDFEWEQHVKRERARPAQAKEKE